MCAKKKKKNRKRNIRTEKEILEPKKKYQNRKRNIEPKKKSSRLKHIVFDFYLL